MQSPDKELVRAYRNGDGTSFALLVESYLKVLYHLARSFVADDDAVEDIVQDTVIKMWRNLARYDDTQAFRPWLMRIAHNTAIDYIRKKRPQAFSVLESSEAHESFGASIPDTEPRADEILMREDEQHEVENLLSVLSPQYREIVILRHYGDLSFEEIGIVMQKPLNTVKSQHRRAIQKLRLILGEETKAAHDAPQKEKYS